LSSLSQSFSEIGNKDKNKEKDMKNQQGRRPRKGISKQGSGVKMEIIVAVTIS